jgi:hypothetical protein
VLSTRIGEKPSAPGAEEADRGLCPGPAACAPGDAPKAARGGGSRRSPAFPVFVEVSKGTAGLGKDSVVDAGQLATVLKQDLGRKLGILPDPAMREVDKALAISLGLALPRG